MDLHGKSLQRGLDMLTTSTKTCKSQEKLHSSLVSPHRHGVMLYFLERTAWLPAEAAIPRHKSGHLGDVLIITCYLQNAHCVPRTLVKFCTNRISQSSRQSYDEGPTVTFALQVEKLRPKYRVTLLQTQRF